VIRDGGLRYLRVAGSGSVISAEPADGGRVEVLVVAHRRASRMLLDSMGTEIRTTKFDLPIRVSSAAKLGDMWYAAGADSEGALRVYRLAEVRSDVVARIPRGQGGRDTGAVAAHLSVSGSDLIVSLVRTPYTVWRISATSAESVTVTQPRDDPRVGPLVAGENMASWAALRGIAVDSGTVHTLADLASDARVVFVVNHRGRILSVKRIAAPLGFVDSSLPTRRICAVRNTGFRELVCYEWQWTQ
jgi:hypothetical protein